MLGAGAQFHVIDRSAAIRLVPKTSPSSSSSCRLSVKARQIFDSRDNPTVEVNIILSYGTLARAVVPSGASTGVYEALELRDGGKDYLRKGVSKAVNNVNTIIGPALIGNDLIQLGKITEEELKHSAETETEVRWKEKRKNRKKLSTCRYYHQPGDQKYVQYSKMIQQPAAIITNQLRKLHLQSSSFKSLIYKSFSFESFIYKAPTSKLHLQKLQLQSFTYKALVHGIQRLPPNNRHFGPYMDRI
ncbi:hypothetical protein ACFX13_034461 [Malus domestica]